MASADAKRAARGGGSVRIISGEWRSRRLQVPDIEGLRPSGDRIRETLFSWLGTEVVGARCLDLFAGTGALGFEAASRGAGEVVMLERSAVAVAGLRASADTLQATQVEIIQADALLWLQGEKSRFDVVFLDPPFGEDLLQKVYRLLDAGWLAPRGRVYLEWPRGEELRLPAAWVMERTKQAGRVQFALAAPKTQDSAQHSPKE
jgi:16S rRNA (guanine966-N2)-methyltransferase